MGGEPRPAYLGGQGSPNTDHHLLLVMVHSHIEGGFIYLGGGWLVSPSAMAWGQTQASDLSRPPSQPGDLQGCRPSHCHHGGPLLARLPAHPPCPPSSSVLLRPECYCPACCVQSTTSQGLTAFSLDSFPQRRAREPHYWVWGWGLLPSTRGGVGRRAHPGLPRLLSAVPAKPKADREGSQQAAACRGQKLGAAAQPPGRPPQPLTASWQEV